ncbi:hypothetical protein ANN_13276 [Periplaneta americana]|uniref:DUF6451 domain-containing protein n=1 Tax=Periplaneta americana TaxID=6978 RepID=A0ABQ8TJF6_PERAM|nr:hypothetical protein ANN_13276 [Periplaneta americana]
MSPRSSSENYPAFAHVGLRENPGKNLNQITCPDRESNPGHLVSLPDALAVTPHVGGADIDVKNNINKVKGAFVQLHPILFSKEILSRTKSRSFETKVKSILLYGCETWRMKKDATMNLQTLVNRCLRYIIRIWSPNVTSNEELWGITNQKPITEQIKRWKWKWIGYTLRQLRST